jgi:hypothetical protein
MSERAQKPQRLRACQSIPTPQMEGGVFLSVNPGENQQATQRDEGNLEQIGGTAGGTRRRCRGHMVAKSGGSNGRDVTPNSSNRAVFEVTRHQEVDLVPKPVPGTDK